MDKDDKDLFRPDGKRKAQRLDRPTEARLFKVIDPVITVTGTDPDDHNPDPAKRKKMVEYSPGWDDKRVSEVTGVPVEAVRNYRNAVFGKIRAYRPKKEPIPAPPLPSVGIKMSILEDVHDRVMAIQLQLDDVARRLSRMETWWKPKEEDAGNDG